MTGNEDITNESQQNEEEKGGRRDGNFRPLLPTRLHTRIH